MESIKKCFWRNLPSAVCVGNFSDSRVACKLHAHIQASIDGERTGVNSGFYGGYLILGLSFREAVAILVLSICVLWWDRSGHFSHQCLCFLVENPNKQYQHESIHVVFTYLNLQQDKKTSVGATIFSDMSCKSIKCEQGIYLFPHICHLGNYTTIFD